jgi:hypothetical protein
MGTPFSIEVRLEFPMHDPFQMCRHLQDTGILEPRAHDLQPDRQAAHQRYGH